MHNHKATQLVRKMIVPEAGRKLADGVDFVRLMYSSSISERGVNADLYYSKIGNSQASADLKGFSCNKWKILCWHVYEILII